MMRKGIIAANWKMNGTHTEVTQFVNALATFAAETPGTNPVEVIFAPPAIYLDLAQGNLAQQSSNLATPFSLAAQDASQHDNGAYTGEISMAMLRDMNCQHVILGHSERRQYFAETNAVIYEKITAAFNHGITPILCIGEQDQDNQQGKTTDVLTEQLALAIEKLSENQKQQIIIAYEPVWAIGTGRTPSIDEIEKIHQKIRSIFTQNNDTIARDLRILYGGSVNPDNASAIFKCPNVDGALVGGASLKIDSFKQIIKAY